MKRYIKSSQSAQLLSVSDFLSLIDSYLSSCEGNYSEIFSAEELNSKVTKVMLTTSFDKNLKKLAKNNRHDVIEKLKDYVIKLCNYEVTTQGHNHKLTNQSNPNRLSDIHLAGDVILLYRYVTNDLLAFDLELTNLTSHKLLSKNMAKKHNKLSRELDNDEDLVDNLMNPH